MTCSRESGWDSKTFQRSFESGIPGINVTSWLVLITLWDNDVATEDSFVLEECGNNNTKCLHKSEKVKVLIISVL